MKSYSELHSDLCELCPIYGETGSDHCFEDALQYVIGMLEQEPVIDKIRAEIEQAQQGYEASMDYTDGAREQELSWVLDVIDKYKAEQER
jgi:hypothetical protein